jgi:hypothetical protein
MRSSIVPAQITTVEDKVAGNLSMPQLFLLFAPIIVGGVIYLIFPPSLGSSLYKIVLIAASGLVLWLSAIRFRGRILLAWAVTIGRYNLRPRWWVFDKNDMYLRAVEFAEDLSVDGESVLDEAEEVSATMPAMSFADSVFLEHIMADPKANLHFKTNRKGKMSVLINEDK